jgi:hypothetical protein
VRILTAVFPLTGMPRLSAVLLVGLWLFVAGCFQSAATLTVRPDGSATLVERYTFDDAFAETVGDLSALGDGPDGEFGPDAEEIAERAAALGPGIRVAHVERSRAPFGFTIEYAVDDVRTLRYTPFADANNALGEAPDEGNDGTMRFGFTPGETATLQIEIAESGGAGALKPGPKPSPQEQAQARQMLQQAREMLGSASISVEVAVEGDIVETDAAFVEGSAVSLLDLRVGRLFDLMLANPSMLRTERPSQGQLQQLMARDPGARYQPPGTVTVRFR